MSVEIKVGIPTGFIDFIVEPTFTVMTEMIEKIMAPLMEEACLLGLEGFRRSRSVILEVGPPV